MFANELVDIREAVGEVDLLAMELWNLYICTPSSITWRFI
jgi:hypothetical protein